MGRVWLGDFGPINLTELDHYAFRYLQFVKAETMVFLQDKTDTVISLPPLTNSEISKVCTQFTTSQQ